MKTDSASFEKQVSDLAVAKVAKTFGIAGDAETLGEFHYDYEDD